MPSCGHVSAQYRCRVRYGDTGDKWPPATTLSQHWMARRSSAAAAAMSLHKRQFGIILTITVAMLPRVEGGGKRGGTSLVRECQEKSPTATRPALQLHLLRLVRHLHLFPRQLCTQSDWMKSSRQSCRWWIPCWRRTARHSRAVPQPIYLSRKIRWNSTCCK